MGSKAPAPVIQQPVAAPPPPTTTPPPSVPIPAGQTSAGQTTQQTSTGQTVTPVNSNTQQPVSADGRVRDEEERRRAQATARSAAAQTIMTAPLGLQQLANIGKAKLGS